MNELHLFAGCGGGILGGILLGHTCVCAVELDPYCRKVLLQRQRDGILPKFPIWGDVRTFDGKPWRGKVDVVCGGFPCQDISIAGTKKGIEGEQSSLWKEQARIIGEVRPQKALIENSPMLTIRGLEVVLQDLAEMGYDAKWGVYSACSVGAPHTRERLFIVGNASGERWMVKKQTISSEHAQCNQQSCNPWETLRPILGNGHGEKVFCFPNSDAVGGINGMADWMDRFDASGNGQVPAVVKLAWETLT